MPNHDLLFRFELMDGQFFHEYRYKNLHWYLGEKKIGFGDLRDEDISRIAMKLKDGEEFIGWNEHHGSLIQQTKTPMVRITNNNIFLREDIVKVEGR